MVAPLSLLFIVGAVVFGSAGDARAQANVTNAYTTGGTIASGTFGMKRFDNTGQICRS